MEGFAARLRAAMESAGMGAADLAERAGVSRQTVYNLLRPDFDPLSPGVRKVAKALGFDPLDLLPRQDEPAGLIANVLGLLRAAAERQDARAFEVLPAALAALAPGTLASLNPRSDAEIRVLGAGVAMAADLTAAPSLHDCAEGLRRREDPHHAIFFGGRFSDPMRVVEATPEPLRRHRVFGAFDPQDFRRHLGRV